jgi:cellulose synthase/poly-beta-1,6-N-acetylglucosamine synthase-like glycosyltransferase
VASAAVNKKPSKVFGDLVMLYRDDGIGNDVAVSLIIGTRNRCRQLGLCVEAVLRIEFERRWELIVVDNGSTDETATIVEDLSATAPFTVTYVSEARKGLGNAHNAGLAVAKGSILAFTDDDCYPAPDFLGQIWQVFGDPSVGYITGRIILHDPTDYPAVVMEATTPRMFPAGSFVHVGQVQGANMAFRRQALLSVGGFDPLFGPGSLFNAEDADAAGRVSAQGWKGKYCPEVIVRHHHRRKAADFAHLWRSYDIGTGAYHMKVLLKGRRLSWFGIGLFAVRRRIALEGRPQRVVWETLGALWYGYLHLTGFCNLGEQKRRQEH